MSQISSSRPASVRERRAPYSACSRLDARRCPIRGNRPDRPARARAGAGALAGEGSRSFARSARHQLAIGGRPSAIPRLKAALGDAREIGRSPPAGPASPARPRLTSHRRRDRAARRDLCSIGPRPFRVTTSGPIARRNAQHRLATLRWRTTVPSMSGKTARLPRTTVGRQAAAFPIVARRRSAQVGAARAVRPRAPDGDLRPLHLRRSTGVRLTGRPCLYRRARRIRPNNTPRRAGRARPPA